MQQAESIATHLGLNKSQKQAVLKLYKAEEGKQRQKREVAMAKRSDKDRANREKAAKSKKTRKAPKASKKTKSKSTTSLSDRILMTAYGKARSNPNIMKELEKIFTLKQYQKWQELGKR